MLILVPFVVIILIVFTVDALYFDDVKPKDELNQKVVEKQDNRKDYINRYIEKK